jgi:MFS family permease
MKFLFLFPVVTAVSVYMGLMYAYFYLLITTITSTFEDVYHFKPNIVGLAYLGLGVGYLVGPIVFASLSDRLLKRNAAKTAGESAGMKPEYRLPLAIVGGISVPVAFFWYGWSAQARTHWIVPIIGPAFLGFGNSLIFVCLQSCYSMNLIPWLANKIPDVSTSVSC